MEFCGQAREKQEALLACLHAGGMIQVDALSSIPSTATTRKKLVRVAQ
jgi:hypothetical protein